MKVSEWVEKAKKEIVTEIIKSDSGIKPMPFRHCYMKEYKIKGTLCRMGPCKSKSIFITDQVLFKDALMDEDK